ncbi:YndM family protein [Lederbergia graminis]|uniref:YndM family protein n=1 Tax=Lederbergia graminis TaxID=735518 RepID=A0ABW0LHJ1_9BACI
MRHIKAISMKFIATLVLLYAILGLIYGMSFGSVFMISLVLGITSYIIGDLFLLPRTNNTIATIADFGLALLVIWVMTESMVIGDNEFTYSLISAIGVVVFESFFHKYMAIYIHSESREDGMYIKNFRYQTEASEEFTDNISDVEKRNDVER